MAAVAASLLLCLIYPLTVFLYLKFYFGKLRGPFQNLSVLSRDEVVVAGFPHGLLMRFLWVFLEPSSL